VGDGGRRRHGQDRIAAIDFVAGATADDLPTNIRAMRALVKGFPARPLAPEDVETQLSSSMTVPAPIRANLVARQIDGDDRVVLVSATQPARPACSSR
jgi:hypothetical protein